MRAAALLVAAGALGVLPPGLAAQSLQVQPDSLDFGALKAGRTGLLEVSVRNAGSEDLEIRVQVEGEGFSAPTDTLHLAAGGHRSLAVEFSAADTGAYAGELSLQTGELFGTEQGRVGLGASVERPRLILRPGPGQGLDAGPAPVGRVVRRSLELVNAGRVELAIDSLSIEPRGGPFSLAGDPPRRMTPGAGGRVDVLFRPAGDGGYRARVRVHSPDLPDTWVPLAGEGMAPRLAVSPLPEVGIDFESVEVGSDSRRPLTLINQGRGDLDLSLQLADEAFEAAGDTAIHLEPGARRDVGVRFHPRYEGPAGAVLSLSSNDPQRRLVEVPLTGLGRVAPAQVEVLENSPLHFGSVPVGKEARAPLLMWNRGGSPCMVRLELEEESGPEFGLETGTLLLNPGESGRVELTFRPQEVGLRQAALLVHTEAGPRRLELQGSGRFLQIMPSAHDFGRVPVGESGSGIIELTNTGNSDFSIGRIHSTSDDFTIFTQLSPDGEYLLPANGLRSLPVRVTFAPSARGPVSGTLRLEGFWEGAAATLEVLLNGTGVAAEIELHPSGVLDFEHVVVGESGQRTLVATNSGDTALQVEANPLSEEARVEPAAFSLDPGESTTLHVHFSPEALGERFAQILLISNDVSDKAQPIKIRGRGALGSIDLPSIVSVLATGKSEEKRLDVPWNPAPLILRDGTRIDLRIDIPDTLRPALEGRRIDVEWVQLDENYDPQGRTPADPGADPRRQRGQRRRGGPEPPPERRRHKAGAPAADHAQPSGGPGAVDLPGAGVRRLEVVLRAEAPRLVPRHPPGADTHRRRRRSRGGEDGAAHRPARDRLRRLAQRRESHGLGGPPHGDRKRPGGPVDGQLHRRLPRPGGLPLQGPLPLRLRLGHLRLPPEAPARGHPGLHPHHPVLRPVLILLDTCNDVH